MGQNSAIEWTETTWNPLTGCTKISPGCQHCYAERMSLRLQAMGQANYANGFELTLQEHMVDAPLKWRKPRFVFVNSMSDLFHKDTPEEFILRVFDVMRRASWHVFQVLTKRSDRLVDMSRKIDWPENVWMGVSVEQMDYTFRIDDLRKTGAKVRFLSLEPLIGPLHGLNLNGIHWAIVGGESGPEPGRSSRNGSPTFAINASRRRCRSFSSSGAACSRSELAAPWTDEPGMRCRSCGREPRRAELRW